MAAMKNSLIACILATWALVAVNGAVNLPAMAPVAAGPGPGPGPGPGTDCNSLIYDMVDCLSYLSIGSNETTPNAMCCDGFKMVVETDANCICEGIKSSVDLGVAIDMNKAAQLPSGCGVHAPPLSTCDVSLAPGASPANPPPATAPTPKLPEPVAPTPPVADTPSPPVADTPSPPVADAPSPPVANAPAPPVADVPATGGRGLADQAPAPSTVHSGAYAITYSSAVNLAITFVSFFYFLLA